MFVGATDLSSGSYGLVPAPQAGDNHLFLRGDGTWAEPAINHIILTLENVDQSSHAELIAAAVDENTSGDIVIIKDLIAENKWQYTAYVFDENEWHAMDGNYNAENVYFDEDLLTTSEIGYIDLVNGQAMIPAAGKNLKQVFETIFVKEEYPEAVEPSVSLTFSNSGAYEVGSKVSPSYIATFSRGSYTYGPATGITVSNWEITDSEENVLTTNKGSFNEITITDDTDYSITAVANYTEGAMPITNLGNEYADARLLAGSVSATKGGLTGYRATFYGTFENKNEMTSATIRTLTVSSKALSNGSQVVVPIPLGAYRVVFAYPADLDDLLSVTDTNGLGAEILSGFNKILLDVEGSNHYDAKSYKVYYIDYAEANNITNSYTFTIGEGG